MPIRNVADAMRELKFRRSPHIQKRSQAIAIGLRAQRGGKTIGGAKGYSTGRSGGRRVSRASGRGGAVRGGR